MNTFVGNKKGFSEPVLVKIYDNSTIERIGFITNESLNSLGIKSIGVYATFLRYFRTTFCSGEKEYNKN